MVESPLDLTSFFYFFFLLTSGQGTERMRLTPSSKHDLMLHLPNWRSLCVSYLLLPVYEMEALHAETPGLMAHPTYISNNG